MENQLTVLNKEFSKKQKSLDMWSEFEGIALWLQGDIDMWWNCDDACRIGDLAGLWGAAVIQAIHDLITMDQFKPDSNLPNLGLVLSMFLKFSSELDEQTNECAWTGKAVRLAKQHRVKLEGLYNVKEIVEDIEDKWAEEGEEDDDQEGYINWGKTDWKAGFKKYSRDYSTGKTSKIGGKNFDITRMSQTEIRGGYYGPTSSDEEDDIAWSD